MSVRAGRIVRNIVIAVVAAFALVALLFLWCSQTDAGRQFVGRQVAQAVTKNIPGRLQIGKVTSFDGEHLEAYDVRFAHPDGRAMLHIEKAFVDLDVSCALSGKLCFDAAEADGGYIVLSTDPDGRLSFEATVNAKAKPGEPQNPHGGLHYDMRNMHAKNFKVRLKLDPLDWRVSKIDGFVRIRRIETSGTQVILEHMRGDVEQEIAGEHLGIKSLDGWVHGKEKHVASFQAGLRIGKGELGTHVNVFDREKQKLVIKVDKKEGAEATAVTWLMHAVAGFTSDIKVDG